jgi:hypothetical protein
MGPQFAAHDKFTNCVRLENQLSSVQPPLSAALVMSQLQLDNET